VTGFEDKLASTPVEFFTMYFEHFSFPSSADGWGSHGQDDEALFRAMCA
jgi:hypothetical protein